MSRPYCRNASSVTICCKEHLSLQERCKGEVLECAGKESPDPMQLAVLDHPKVVNSAYFSPISGSKILTTCIDNRC